MLRTAIASIVSFTVYLSCGDIATPNGLSAHRAGLRRAELLITFSVGEAALVGQFATQAVVYPLMAVSESSDDKTKEGQNTGNKREDPQPPKPPKSPEPSKVSFT